MYRSVGPSNAVTVRQPQAAFSSAHASRSAAWPALAPSARRGFEHAHAGRAHGDHAPAFQLGLVDLARDLGAERAALGVDVMVLDRLALDRAKGVQADLEVDKGQLDALLAQLEQQFGRKVQAGGRRGDRALLAGIDGLVALRVGDRGA